MMGDEANRAADRGELYDAGIIAELSGITSALLRTYHVEHGHTEPMPECDRKLCVETRAVLDRAERWLAR